MFFNQVNHIGNYILETNVPIYEKMTVQMKSKVQWTSEMTQWIWALAVSTNDLSSILTSHIVERENLVTQAVL